MGDEKTVAFDDDWFQRGFTMLPNAVLLNGHLSLGARLFYAVLVHYARQTEECWPSQPRVAVNLGVSERSLRTYLRELEDCRLVRTVARPGRSNVYRLSMPDAAYMADLDRQGTPANISGTPADSADRSRSTEEEKRLRRDEPITPTPEGDLGETLFTVDPTPSSPPAEPVGDLHAPIGELFNHHVLVFGDRLRIKTLTPPRYRMLAKALKATGADTDGATSLALCKRAIDGLRMYRAAHPDGSQDVSLSTIFETGPHSGRNLTDQIEFWASQADSGRADIGPEVPSVLHARVTQRRLAVVEMHSKPGDEFAEQRGMDAMRWLREQIGEEPVVEDGKVTGWRKVTT